MVSPLFYFDHGIRSSRFWDGKPIENSLAQRTEPASTAGATGPGLQRGSLYMKSIHVLLFEARPRLGWAVRKPPLLGVRRTWRLTTQALRSRQLPSSSVCVRLSSRLRRRQPQPRLRRPWSSCLFLRPSVPRRPAGDQPIR